MMTTRLPVARIAPSSGTMSPSQRAEALSRTGATRLVLIDHDVLEERNLDRTLGAFFADAKKKSPKVEVAKRMVARELPKGGHRGTIIFTGATASLRGAANFGAFSGAKMALRALAQSMARELGPQGIHVAHVVVDGAIDTEFIRTNFPERYALKESDGILNPEHIADSYWMLHSQPRDAWTHELDLRPWSEKF